MTPLANRALHPPTAAGASPEAPQAPGARRFAAPSAAGSSRTGDARAGDARAGDAGGGHVPSGAGRFTGARTSMTFVIPT